MVREGIFIRQPLLVDEGGLAAASAHTCSEDVVGPYTYTGLCQLVEMPGPAQPKHG